MTKSHTPVAIVALAVAPRTTPSVYPEPFASRMRGRTKRVLGDLFGLSNFGINLVVLAPGAESALRHAHSRQDEFVYVLRGSPSLITDAGETVLVPGMCAGFRAASGDAHKLVNRSNEEAHYLEVGDRSADDTAAYPDDDLKALRVDGRWRLERNDGTPY